MSFNNTVINNTGSYEPVIAQNQTSEEKIVNNKSIGTKLRGLILKIVKVAGHLICGLCMIAANIATLGTVNLFSWFRNSYAPVFLGRPTKQKTNDTNSIDKSAGDREIVSPTKPKTYCPLLIEIKEVRKNLRHVEQNTVREVEAFPENRALEKELSETKANLQPSTRRFPKNNPTTGQTPVEELTLEIPDHEDLTLENHENQTENSSQPERVDTLAQNNFAEAQNNNYYYAAAAAATLGLFAAAGYVIANR